MTETVFDNFKLDDQVCLVTGASRGLGRAIAVALAQAGADVVLTARNQNALQETAALIEKQGRRSLVVPCDVCKGAEVDAVVQRALATFGHIDVLVNNAGGGEFKPLVDVSEEEWTKWIDLDLHSVFRFCKAVGPGMIERRRGSIINMASMYGLNGATGATAYCASKGGVIQLTRALALEWAEHNIRVNALAPGFIYTAMTSSIFDDPTMGAAFLSHIPLKRVGQPEELGPLVVYLASDASAFMTGSVIVIDGGQSAQ
jgi:NAD(P)-dependent dehydrogenase (short-subunit alcohol dehydrogenase family)